MNKGTDEMMKEIRDFDASRYLTDEEAIAALINEAIADGDPKVLAMALNDIMKARNVSQIAKEAGISRATMYNILDGATNPSGVTLNRIFNALGLVVRVAPREQMDTDGPLTA